MDGGGGGVVGTDTAGGGGGVEGRGSIEVGVTFDLKFSKLIVDEGSRGMEGSFGGGVEGCLGGGVEDSDVGRLIEKELFKESADLFEGGDNDILNEASDLELGESLGDGSGE